MRKSKVHIVGPQNFQNQLLARYLEKESGCMLSCSTGRYWKLDESDSPMGNDLTLLDFDDYEWKDLWLLLKSRSDSAPPLKFALFNVNPDYDSNSLNANLLHSGLCGVFDRGESLKQMFRGVRDMLNGELWIRRKILTELLISNEPGQTVKRHKPNRESPVNIRILK